jgi:asparagine synthase (glutamine-hydrolysing)
MCGICGFVGRPDPLALGAMTRSLAHRGPDAEGAWSGADAAVHFGHRRLSVLDLSGGGQPMHSWDGRYTIVFNGEIYNHAELRRELVAAGTRFNSDHSDTEVLLEGFRLWGDALQTRLNGMWAFAIHDSAAGELFLSRDRFGKKPLFYFHTGDSFAFASELATLRHHPALPHGGRLSARAVQKYYAYGYIPTPLTAWEDVSKLPGGHSLRLDLRTRKLRGPTPYWRFVLEPQDPGVPPETLAEELVARLRGAVERRLAADVPVGVFLSGGVDSSAVAAFASAARGRGNLESFTLGFEERSFDESTHAALVARHLGTLHHERRLSMEEARRLAPEILAHLDEPMADSSLLPCDLLSAHARTRVSVALSGDGADELFAGYDPFLALRRAEHYRRWVPKPVHAAIAHLAGLLPVSHRNMSFDFKLKRTLRGLGSDERLQLPLWMAPLTPAELRDLLGAPIDPEDVFSEALHAWERAPKDPVSRALQFYSDLYLRDDILVKMDRASMRHGLEVRAPFLDNDVVDFARRLPVEQKFSGGRTKVLLKRALAPYLPAETLHRAKKGFGVPIGAWFRSGGLRYEASRSPYPRFAAQRHAWHVAGKRDERAFLWADWVLSLWRGRR